MPRSFSIAWPFAIIASLLLLCGVCASATKASAAQMQKQSSSGETSSRQAEDLKFFEKKAALSKELGATHMLVTDGLPPATWEMNPADPYPMWFVHHASLLTIFPPAELEPFVDTRYAAANEGHSAAAL